MSYAPLSQQSQQLSDSLKIQNDVSNLSFLTGYTFRTSAGLVSSTNFSFVFQEGKTLSGIGAYVSRNSMLTQVVGFAFPMSLSAAIGLTQSTVEANSTQILSFDVSGSYSFPNGWQNTLAVTLMRDAVIRSGISLSSSVPIGSLVTLAVGVDRTTFEDPTGASANYGENVVRVTLSKAW